MDRAGEVTRCVTAPAHPGAGSDPKRAYGHSRKPHGAGSQRAVAARCGTARADHDMPVRRPSQRLSTRLHRPYRRRF